MIDLHSHILPSMDDGPQKLADFLAMARFAVNEGITDIYATPHHRNEQYINKKNDILNHLFKYNEILIQENIPLVIHAGQELRIHREIFTSLEKDEILTLDNNGKYLLLELPSYYVPNYTYEIVYELLLQGITPIIVHPERNRGFIENNHLLFELVQEGALTQLTSGSIIGQFGKKIKTFSKKIIEHHLAHFIATDAHNISSRGFTLNEAYDSVTKLFGHQYTFFFRENAELLLKGFNVDREQPIPIKKRIFWNIR